VRIDIVLYARIWWDLRLFACVPYFRHHRDHRRWCYGVVKHHESLVIALDFGRWLLASNKFYFKVYSCTCRCVYLCICLVLFIRFDDVTVLKFNVSVIGLLLSTVHYLWLGAYRSSAAVGTFFISYLTVST